jgi:RNase P subunit RPR2
MNDFLYWFIPLIYILIWIGQACFSYFNYFNNEKMKSPWKSLAESNHLTFLPASWLGGGAFVFGNYRGYRLRLETFKQDKEIHTRLTLSLNPMNTDLSEKNIETRGKQIVIEDLADLFASVNSPHPRGQEIKFGLKDQKVYYEQRGLELDIEYLQSVLNRLADLVGGYSKVVLLGGEAVPFLKKIATNNYHALQRVAAQLLHDIGQETTLRLSSQAEHLFCSNCLVCCGEHKVHLSWWQPITYYGCRSCGQSQEFFEFKGQVTAVLNSQMNTEKFKQNGVLRVNWLARRKLFDFDEVEIVQATDEDVERFAVQVGNDTDPKRKPRYQEMRCVVSPKCHLSENTMRILERMFGVVEVGGGQEGRLKLKQR